MRPLQVNLPDVTGPGGRKGWNKLVVGIKNGTDFQGEYLEGDKAEMLPGDLLLSVRPIGKAKDHKQGALLYVADDNAENNLRNLVVRADWPQCQEFLAQRCEGLLAGRIAPGECPQCDEAPSQVAIVVKEAPEILGLRVATCVALANGVDPAEVQQIVSNAIASYAGKV